MLYVLLAAATLVVAFVVWRWTSVGRGARRRDALLHARLAELEARLEEDGRPPAAELDRLAASPELRPMLYALLSAAGRAEAFPERYLDVPSQGASELAYWLMHPNEYGAPPQAIELVRTVERRLEPEGAARFLVFRFRMPAEHWAGAKGWLLGCAGPYGGAQPPYAMTGAFARSDAYGEVEPAELVDRFIALATRRA